MDTSTSLGNRELAVAMKRALDAAYFRKGIAVAALSSCMYALYTAFVTAGQLFGVWAGWFDAFAPSGLLAVFILPTIASGVNDVLSAVWATFFTAGQGKLADLGRCIASKPGVIVIAAAFIGGPIASAAYVIALSQAGTLAVPIAALNPAISAVLARVLYRQPLSPRVVTGIVVCVVAGAMIGSAGLSGQASSGTALGMAINGTYTFTAPLFTWIIVGLVLGFDGYALPSVAWVAAVVNLVGICLIAVNPLDMVKKDGDRDASA